MADHVKIRLLKEYFMNPRDDSWKQKLRNLASIAKYDDGEYLTFTQELPLMMAS